MLAGFVAAFAAVASTVAAASSCSSVDISTNADDFLSGRFYAVDGEYFERSGEDPTSTSSGASLVTRLLRFESSNSSSSSSDSGSGSGRRLKAVQHTPGDRAAPMGAADVKRDLRSSRSFIRPTSAPASGSSSDTSFSDSTNSPTFAPTPAPFAGDVACEAGPWVIIRYDAATDTPYYPFLGAILTSDDCQGASSVIDALSTANWFYYDLSDAGSSSGSSTNSSSSDSSSSSSGVAATASLACVGGSAFSITLISVDGDDTYSQYFNEAAARWEEVITGDLPDYDGGVVQDWFYGAFDDIGYTFSGPVDDLVIGYRVTTIDGEGTILGHAAPLSNRANLEGSSSSGSDGTADFTSVSGFMEFDVADVEQLVADGSFFEVVLHEMGHVLGIGSTWFDAKCTTCVAPSSTSSSSSGPSASGSSSSISGSPDYNPSGSCPAATEAFATISDSVLLVENAGGEGTACSHFEETQLDNELMTGIAEEGSTAMPLSIISIGALEDLGYEVDYDAADPYTLPSTSGRRAAEDSTTPKTEKKLRLDLRNDVLPIKAGQAGQRPRRPPRPRLKSRPGSRCLAGSYAGFTCARDG